MLDQLGRTHEADCLEGMRQLPNACIDAVITDPPYSSGARREATKGGQPKSMTRGVQDQDWFGTDSLTTNGFSWLMRQCAVEWFRVLRPGGHVLVFIDWRMMPTLSGAIESADLRHNGVLVWDKTYFGMGHYFRNQYELILHFSKGKGVEPQRRDTGNVLSFKPIRGGNHPTEKPVELLERLITTVVPPNGIILDCFAGSGSIGVAASATGRQFIGFEREPKYVEVANDRIKSAAG